MKKHNITEAMQELGIKEIFFDSRKVIPGSAFFCIQYARYYIEEALANGAALVVCNTYDEDAKILVARDVRAALAEAAAFLYPHKPKYMVAATGTSGKTSVVDYYRQISAHLGYNAASVGTLGICCSDSAITISQPNNSLTTQDVVTMHQTLELLSSGGVTHVAFEASSHGIDQKRMGEIFVDAAAFTSFSQDHLEYHNTMEAYKFAKLKLFPENLKSGGRAIVTTDLMEDEDIARTFTGEGIFSNDNMQLVTVGKHGTLDITSCEPSIDGQTITFAYNGREYNIVTPIVGSFQASNLLIAASMLEACDVDFEDIVAVLPKITSVPGRLERVTDLNSPWHVFVDYSHKPGALESSLKEMRLLCKNRLHVVFGCGGDRDPSKRKPMGEVAAKFADIVIVTDDNPRTEDAASIRNAAMSGCPRALEIGDRGEAIKYAIEHLKEGDILMIAGKGNEDYQIIGNTKIRFDDREEVRKYL